MCYHNITTSKRIRRLLVISYHTAAAVIGSVGYAICRWVRLFSVHTRIIYNSSPSNILY